MPFNQLIFSSSNTMDTFVEAYSLHKIGLLREFCRKTGIQIFLREYDFDNKKHATFSDEDVVNLFPIVKCVTPKATDATNFYEAAQSRLQSGKFRRKSDTTTSTATLLHSTVNIDKTFGRILLFYFKML